MQLHHNCAGCSRPHLVRTNLMYICCHASLLQVAAPDSMPLAFKDETSEELVADVYRNKGQLQQPLADAAADAVRSGGVDSSSAWLQAFEKVRPGMWALGVDGLCDGAGCTAELPDGQEVGAVFCIAHGWLVIYDSFARAMCCGGTRLAALRHSSP